MGDGGRVRRRLLLLLASIKRVDHCARGVCLGFCWESQYTFVDHFTRWWSGAYLIGWVEHVRLILTVDSGGICADRWAISYVQHDRRQAEAELSLVRTRTLRWCRTARRRTPTPGCAAGSSVFVLYVGVKTDRSTKPPIVQVGSLAH